GVGGRRLANGLLARVRAGGPAANDGRYDVDADGFADLALELQRRYDVPSNRFSRSNAAARFQAYVGPDPSRSESLEGRVVVELGCGGRNPLAALLAFVLAGARPAVGVALDARAGGPPAVPAA